MAQWAYGYSGHTHDTRVLDVEESLRLAVTAHSAATEAERDHKSKAVHHLAGRLLGARLKAARARIARLSEPDQRRKPDTADQLERLRKHEAEVEAQGVDDILREFGYHGTVQV